MNRQIQIAKKHKNKTKRDFIDVEVSVRVRGRRDEDCQSLEKVYWLLWSTEGHILIIKDTDRTESQNENDITRQ